jgi:hypothetical protein
MTDSPATGIAEYRTRPTTHAVVLDDEVLIWDAVGVQLHRLNGSASCVWQELSQWRSPAEVVDALAHAVSVEPARLRDDVTQCIETLLRAGLVDRRAVG